MPTKPILLLLPPKARQRESMSEREQQERMTYSKSSNRIRAKSDGVELVRERERVVYCECITSTRVHYIVRSEVCMSE